MPPKARLFFRLNMGDWRWVLIPSSPNVEGDVEFLPRPCQWAPVLRAGRASAPERVAQQFLPRPRPHGAAIQTLAPGPRGGQACAHPFGDQRALIDLNKGELQFQVRGLVLAGGNAIGTRGGVTQVKGTLVCDTTGTLTGNSTLVDNLVSLSPQGNARFAGQVGPLPSACTSSPNIAFLIRTAGGAWIAAGEVREVESEDPK
jgi:hypothetical protein